MPLDLPPQDFWLPQKPAIIRPAKDLLLPKPAFVLAPPVGWAVDGAAPPAAAIRTFIAATSDTSNQSTYTFTGQSFGGAVVGDYIIVGYVFDNPGGTLSSATIDGQAATKINEVPDSGLTIGFLIAPATGNATGSIVLVLSTGQNRAGIFTWRAQNLQSATPTHTASEITEVSNALSASLTIDTDGFGLGLTFYGGNTTTDFAWTNLTQDGAELTVDGSRTAGAASSTTPGTATRTVTANVSIADDFALSLVAWR